MEIMQVCAVPYSPLPLTQPQEDRLYALTSDNRICCLQGACDATFLTEVDEPGWVILPSVITHEDECPKYHNIHSITVSSIFQSYPIIYAVTEEGRIFQYTDNPEKYEVWKEIPPVPQEEIPF